MSGGPPDRGFASEMREAGASGELDGSYEATARVVDALRAKVEAEGPIGGSAAAPAAETAGEETPADAAPAAEATDNVATGGDDA